MDLRARVRALVLVAVLSPATGLRAQTALDVGFAKPPASARPQTWWHWLNGNVTKAGITADLEAMARVGVGGAEIFNVDQGIPAGPVRFMSPQWLEMMRFAASEADRLGLQLCMHNAAGWSSSGGPWNTPDHAMQFLTTSEQHVTGPRHFDAVLAQPAMKLNSYHDIAVLAFRTPPAEGSSLRGAQPEVTSSIQGLAGERLLDGNPATFVTLPAPTAGASSWIQFTLPAPLRARSLRLQMGPGRNEGGGTLEASDDGQQFHTVRSFGLSRDSHNVVDNFDAASARYWRLTFNRRVNVADVDLSAELRIENIGGKAAFERSEHPAASGGIAGPDAVVSDVTDISAQLQPGGHLTWDVPAGDWTILRIGHTPTGATNEPGPPEGTGPEVDKLSREAVDAHWASAVGPVLKAMGPLAGKSFNDVLIDSYEVGSENWTPRFREDFRERRGYDPVPWLPVITGRVVHSPDASERFLWDLRRTVSDLFAENYAGRFAELAHKSGLMFSAEPYGNGTFEDFQYGGRADIPMGEFWVGGGAEESCKLASSIGHIYGRRVIGAESFTSVPEHARWTNDPYSLKALGDEMYCVGINRFIFHRYAMQPWTDRAPGMTMGPWGIHFERTETWWNQGAAWLTYLGRCQYMLQQGLYVADVAAFCGDDGPNTLQGPAGLPPGYDFDGINAEVLRRATTHSGRLTLPANMSYRVLTLPNRDTMTPETLRHLAELVRGGVVVWGPRPTHSPSLQGGLASDAEVQQLAAAMWGNIDGKTVTEHAYGRGSVFWGQPLPSVLTTLEVQPDFVATDAPNGQVHYIHRITAGADIYFVASAAPHDQDMRCSFRVAGRQPELWQPETGTIEPCPVWRQVGDRTEVPLHFTPSGSVFVVFRGRATGDHLVEVQRQGPAMPRPKSAELTIDKALYGVLNESGDKVDVTHQVQELVRGGQRHITANNELGGDPAANEVKEMRLEFDVNGEHQIHTLTEGESFDLPAGATVTRAVYGLNTEVIPDATQIMDLTTKLQGLVQDGQLHIVTGNAFAGTDPALNVPKQFSVEYTLNGVHKKRLLGENQTLDLPGDVPGPSTPPAFEVQQTANGARHLLVSAPGQFTVTHANGRQQQATVGSLPAPVPVVGPWQVAFPPRLGAPPQATFNQLISWPHATDPGIQYFSGTATYRTSFVVPAGLIGANRRFFLNLGDVQVIAEPMLNGHALGVLWKPPFRADVTGLLRPGPNTLEVQVTNLWPNRLIGDEQFPDDTKYNAGGNIAAWPEWLLQGTPRPEPRRITFSTWKHWHKGDDLLPSGLLGPVSIETAVPVPLR